MLVSALAIILVSRYPQGEWITLREVLTTSPACWFRILWFALAFVSANGFTKEYRSRHHLVVSILINQYEENIDKSLRM